VAIALGVAATQIPWGDPEGFHGKGFPFASVYWEYRNGAKDPVDFPNPFAAILNSVAFLIIGSTALLAIHWIAAGVRKLRSNRSAGVE
jgi:hypothetical protein